MDWPDLAHGYISRLPAWVLTVLAFLVAAPAGAILAMRGVTLARRLLRDVAQDTESTAHVRALIGPAIADALQPLHQEMRALSERVATMEGSIQVLTQVTTRDQG